MLNFDEFIPLTQCELAWRWTDARWAVLPTDVLVTMRPLAPAQARRIAGEVWELEKQRRAAAAPLESSLAKLEVDSREPIVVVWSSTMVLATVWRTLREHWDDFIYPGADQVTIVPVDLRWLAAVDEGGRVSWSS